MWRTSRTLLNKASRLSNSRSLRSLDEQRRRIDSDQERAVRREAGFRRVSAGDEQRFTQEGTFPDVDGAAAGKGNGSETYWPRSQVEREGHRIATCR